MLDHFASDLRHGLRMLRQSPGFTTVAVASLALGIGANTCIFSVLNGLMLKSLPVLDPQALCLISAGDTALTNPQWEQLRDHQDFLTSIGAWGSGIFNTGAGGEVVRTWTNWVSGDYFRTLGLHPAIGRLFTAADDRRGCPAIAVLNYGYWQRQYGGDPTILGKSVSLDGHAFEIVGVVQSGFYGMDAGRAIDIEMPLCAEAAVRGRSSALNHRSTFWLRAVARVKPGDTLSQVQARLAALSPGVFEATVPPYWSEKDKQSYRRHTLSAVDGSTGVSSLRRQYGRSLTLLMIAVGVVLLIACTNVANLLLARGAGRQREIAVRLALGAGRARVVRQLLTESTMLALLGAAGGTLLGAWGAPLLVRLLSSSVSPVRIDVSLDLRVLAATAAAALLTGLLFGAAPAWRASRVPPNAALKEGARGITDSRHRLGLNRLLVIAQLALSLLLVIGAGLLLRTFRNLLTQDAGFDRRQVLLADLDLHRTAPPDTNLSALYDGLRARLQALPGVESVSYAGVTPISGSSMTDVVKTDSFRPAKAADATVYFNNVSSGYFQTLGTPLLAGRDIGARDTETAPQVAVINQAMARRFFPGLNPIGRTFRQERPGHPDLVTEVVGVVKDSKYVNLRADAPPTAFMPFAQQNARSTYNTYLLRFGGAPDELMQEIKKAAAENGGLVQFKLLSTQIDDSLVQERMVAMLSGAFGLVALALAGIGLYGVMAYMVVRRRGEIGIRIALGAQPGSVVRLVLRETALLIVAGCILGGAAALATTRLLAAMLYGVTPNDGLTVAIAVAALTAAGALAGYVPARTASRVDPLIALREE